MKMMRVRNGTVGARGVGVLGAVLGALVLGAPGPAAAQKILPAATKVEPGSPASGFAPTAYAVSASELQNDARELDAAQRALTDVAEHRGSPRVKAFAKDVRDAFAGGVAGLKGMSNDQGVPLVGGAKLTREHQTLLDQMQAPRADVDRLFVDDEVLILQAYMGLVEAYATGGTEARLRQAAAEAASSDHVLLSTARSLQH